jgi:hypothetical protein
VDLTTCQSMVRQQHYSQGGSNTGTYLHGLFQRSEPDVCLGVAWWLPPTKSSALATWPGGDWRGVMCLSRLVVDPTVPTNGASFLLGASERLIRQDARFGCLVTYADEWQGHSGAIYRATNWEYVGRTAPEAVWVTADGRMVARKAGPRTRTKAEMLDLGYTLVGRFSKHKFRKVIQPPAQLWDPGRGRCPNRLLQSR